MIINGDEFGLCTGVNRGIVEAHDCGILTSTSAIVSGAGFEEAVDLARARPRLGVGVHLMLTDGLPVSRPDDIPSLVNTEGLFFPRPEFFKRYLRGHVSLDDVSREYNAQISAFKATGLPLTHVDSHQSVYMLPRIFSIALDIARHCRIPLRWPMHADSYRDLFHAVRTSSSRFVKKIAMVPLSFVLRRRLKGERQLGPIVTTDRLITMIDYLDWCRQNPNRLVTVLAAGSSRTCELMTHPGYCDERLRKWVYGGDEEASLREIELDVLTHAGLRQSLQRAGINLIHYGELSNGQ